MIYIIILSCICLYYAFLSRQLAKKRKELEHNIKVLQLELDNSKINNKKYRKEISLIKKELLSIKSGIK